MALIAGAAIAAAVALVAGGVYIKHMVYEQGMQAATLRYTAAAAERTLEAHRRARASLSEASGAVAASVAEVAALRGRADAAAKAAAAARAALRAKQAEAPPECPKPEVPTICAADLPLRQP